MMVTKKVFEFNSNKKSSFSEKITAFLICLGIPVIIALAIPFALFLGALIYSGIYFCLGYMANFFFTEPLTNYEIFKASFLLGIVTIVIKTIFSKS